MKSTRIEALTAVEKWYDTKQPCRNGHLSKRYTVDGSCYRCRANQVIEEREKFRAALAKKVG